jgi:hypothetical protein
MKFFYKTSFLIFFCSSLFGQKVFRNLKYQTTGSIYFSTSKQTPFWQRSNQYGTVPLKNPIFGIEGCVYKEYDSTYSDERRLNKFDIGYGINVVVNVGLINQILLPVGYIKARIGIFEFYGGRRREIIGLMDTTMSSGSYIWSGNALPLPKVQISIPNYTSILGKGLISIKGAFSHGWFDNGFVKDFYLHQKWLYARVGKPNWKIRIYTGFNHQVQWGGRNKVPQYDPNGLVIDKLPLDLEAYLHVISGISVNKGDDGTETGRPLNEEWNRIGNHLGTIDIGAEISFKYFDLLLYRQNIYEDGSLFYLNNIQDGLLGISFKRKNTKNGISALIIEYLNTTSQGGQNESTNNTPQLRGRDNYFNNSTYRNGWSYKDLTPLGTPFIPNSYTILMTLPKIPQIFTSNNLVKAIYCSLQGRYGNTIWTLKYALSKNYGTYNLPYDSIIQNTYFLSILKPYKKISLSSSVALDKGKLFKNTFGLNFKIIRNW